MWCAGGAGPSEPAGRETPESEEHVSEAESSGEDEHMSDGEERPSKRRRTGGGVKDLAVIMTGVWTWPLGGSLMSSA